MEKIKKTMELTDFVYLMLATLADDSKIIDLRDRKKKTISFPTEYKQIIENILCADNGWKDEFSILIDTQEYFEDHFNWEERLTSTIKQTLMNLGKTFEYDIKCDRLLINFTQEEIDMIMSQYQDEELKNTMRHFTNLLVDYIYTREYQEKFHNYSADSTRIMNDMRNSHLITNESSQPKKRVLKFFEKAKIR